jgi:hypothetical protein
MTRKGAEFSHSSSLATHMGFLAAAATPFMAACSLHAGFAGFVVGNGIALTNGVVRVNYGGRQSLVLAPKLRVNLLEAA